MLHTSFGGWSDMEVHCMCRACGRCMVIAVLAMGHTGNGPLLGAYRQSWGSPWLFWVMTACFPGVQV